MGEVERTLERLNEVLVNAGFQKTYAEAIYKDGDHWSMGVRVDLQFDKDGKFVKPENGEGDSQ